MTKDTLVKIFESKFEDMTDMLFNVAVFVEDPDEDDCQTVANALVQLSNAGSMNAAVIYAAITAYDNGCKCFSAATAIELLLKYENSIQAYHNFIHEHFYEIVDEEDFNYFYAAPAIWLSETCLSINDNNTD